MLPEPTRINTLLLLTDDIFELLEGVHRHRHGVRRFKNIRKARPVKIKKKGKGMMIKRARKLHKAIQRGPMFNRHRR